MTIRASQQGAIYFADGTSSNESYRGRIEYIHADDALRFGTAATERMRIDSSGRVGIGMTPESSVGAILQTKDNDGISFRRSDESLSTILRPLASGLGLRVNYQNGSEVARIDSSGRLLVGRTSNITITGDQTDHTF